MSLHHLAAHMQSQGRNGDTGLIHMSPGEIGALQKLAVAHGGSLTINPTTGLPEANFMRDWLPAIVGGLAMFIPGVGPMAAMALAAGGAFGTSMAVGNSFNKSLMAGLTSGAGAGLGAGLGAAGAAAGAEVGGVAKVAGTVGTESAVKAGTTAANTALTGAETFGTTAAQRTAQSALAEQATKQAAQGAAGATQRAAGAAGADIWGGVGNIPGQQIAGKTTGIFDPLAGAPNVSALGTNPNAILGAAPKQTGAQIFQAANPTDKLAMQGKGIEQVFSSPQSAMDFAGNNKGKLIALGTGIAGSNYLSSPQTGIHPPPAQTSDYAGPYMPTPRTAQFPTGPQPWTDTSERQYFDEVNPYPGYVAYDPKNKTPISAADGGLMSLTAGGSFDDEAGQDGGESTNYSYADGGEVAPNKMATPDMNAIQSYVQSINQPQTAQDPRAGGGEHNYGIKPVTVQQAPPIRYAPAVQQQPMELLMNYLMHRPTTNQPTAIVDQYTPYRPQTVDTTIPGQAKSSTEYTDLSKYIYNPDAQRMDMPLAAGGLTSLAKGGNYLDGPGDGLSDSIHATIGNNQPARLADGEFVISADVVSDIGGGSSKAGAKKLHAMMDRVRQSAHGTKKQVRKINDRKVLAA